MWNVYAMQGWAMPRRISHNATDWVRGYLELPSYLRNYWDDSPNSNGLDSSAKFVQRNLICSPQGHRWRHPGQVKVKHIGIWYLVFGTCSFFGGWRPPHSLKRRIFWPNNSQIFTEGNTSIRLWNLYLVRLRSKLGQEWSIKFWGRKIGHATHVSWSSLYR